MPESLIHYLCLWLGAKAFNSMSPFTLISEIPCLIPVCNGDGCFQTSKILQFLPVRNRFVSFPVSCNHLCVGITLRVCNNCYIVLQDLLWVKQWYHGAHFFHCLNKKALSKLLIFGKKSMNLQWLSGWSLVKKKGKLTKKRTNINSP